ncbi:sigma-70 family RNA polymerase sigma factor [Saccharomonospora piscinae]|uniref:sigma-70 family RNA polymerase sigma factor n=1 Tax=Saccharomonospora piscinae TaxID=687388 RepID=UPI001106CD25|nr:sigma-70 family RNA polymerase sigma factor [Saccharomonospora piscinae]TLW93446.1 sigma-70 family RNA polymerase sigma factor [Saccharomonospora piscinae]
MLKDSVSASDQLGLIERIRGGDDAAFGELFQAHQAAVRRLARGLVADAAEAEDVTAETFFRVLQALRRGNGPRENVRAYLLTVARRVAWEWQAARRDVPVSDEELTEHAGVGADWQVSNADASLVTRAFTSLPERWRTVLWRTEVEGEQPAVLAPHFGLSANATAALARRARIGLRAAYLQAHLAAEHSSGHCRGVVRKLGGYTAGSVTGTEATKISHHLRRCSSCRSTHAELRQVCSSLRAYAGALAVVVPLSGLASTASGGAATTGAAVAAGGSAAVGGAGAGGVSVSTATAVAVSGGGKVGLTFVSAAAVVGMVGTPILDDTAPGWSGAPPQGGVVIERSSGEQADSSGTGFGSGRDIAGEGALPGSSGSELSSSGAPSTSLPTSLLSSLTGEGPAGSAGSVSGALKDTEYTLPAWSTTGAVTSVVKSEVSEVSDTVPPDVPGGPGVGDEIRDDLGVGGDDQDGADEADPVRGPDDRPGGGPPIDPGRPPWAGSPHERVAPDTVTEAVGDSAESPGGVDFPGP